jgi:hypothetical protein
VDVVSYVGVGIAFFGVVVSLLVAKVFGARAAQDYLVKEGKRTTHEKLIVDTARKEWGQRIQYQPPSVLQLEWNSDSLNPTWRPHSFPFITSPPLSYFEAHLESGYSELSAGMERLRASYSDLMRRTEVLSLKVRDCADVRLVPERRKFTDQYDFFDTNEFVVGLLVQLIRVADNQVEFSVEMGQQSGPTGTNIITYNLSLAGHSIANVPSLEMVHETELRILRFMKERGIQDEFTKIHSECKDLFKGLPEIRRQLEWIWNEVDNGVHLYGSCKACERMGLKPLAS